MLARVVMVRATPATGTGTDTGIGTLHSQTIDTFIKSAKLPTRIAVGLRKLLKMERRLTMKVDAVTRDFPRFLIKLCAWSRDVLS